MLVGIVGFRLPKASSRRFGGKIQMLPRLGLGVAGKAALSELSELSGIQRPRPGYWGSLAERVSIRLATEVVSRHPEWHFIYFESHNGLGRPNTHALVAA
jgi:hypothetical protein